MNFTGIKLVLTDRKFWGLLVLPLTLLFIAGAANACMDKVYFHYGTSIFANVSDSWQNYFNPILSWHNKWKFDAEGAIIGEKFWGSSTFFVLFTDFWHLMKFVYQNSLIAAFTIFICQALDGSKWSYVVVFMCAKILVMAGFTLFFDFLLKI